MESSLPFRLAQMKHIVDRVHPQLDRPIRLQTRGSLPVLRCTHELLLLFTHDGEQDAHRSCSPSLFLRKAHSPPDCVPAWGAGIDDKSGTQSPGLRPTLTLCPRSLDGIAKHPSQVLEFIEPVGLRLTRGLWQPFGFEFRDDALVSLERLAPSLIGKGLFERETPAHGTRIPILSPIAG